MKLTARFGPVLVGESIDKKKPEESSIAATGTPTLTIHWKNFGRLDASTRI
jgi:hypothetical protein